MKEQELDLTGGNIRSEKSGPVTCLGLTFENDDGPATESELSPMSRKAGALKGRIMMTSDFNAPMDDFAEYEQ